VKKLIWSVSWVLVGDFIFLVWTAKVYSVLRLGGDYSRVCQIPKDLLLFQNDILPNPVHRL
jgi:hypothetical protein